MNRETKDPKQGREQWDDSVRKGRWKKRRRRMEEEEEEQREGKSKGPDFRWEQRVAHAGARGRTKQNGIQGNIPYFHS